MSVHPDDIRRVYYDWVIETVTDDEYEDIIDLSHASVLREYSPQELHAALTNKKDITRYDGEDCPVFTRLALKRDMGCEAEGIEDRRYAYVVDGILSETFEEGGKVPERFRKELAKFTEE
jgi:hypothetical protein